MFSCQACWVTSKATQRSVCWPQWCCSMLCRGQLPVWRLYARREILFLLIEKNSVHVSALDTSFVTVLILPFVTLLKFPWFVFTVSCVFWQKIMGCNKSCKFLKSRKILFCMIFRTFLFKYHFNWLKEKLTRCQVIYICITIIVIIAVFVVIVKMNATKEIECSSTIQWTPLPFPNLPRDPFRACTVPWDVWFNVFAASANMADG